MRGWVRMTASFRIGALFLGSLPRRQRQASDRDHRPSPDPSRSARTVQGTEAAGAAPVRAEWPGRIQQNAIHRRGAEHLAHQIGDAVRAEAGSRSLEVEMQKNVHASARMHLPGREAQEILLRRQQRCSYQTERMGSARLALRNRVEHHHASRPGGATLR